MRMTLHPLCGDGGGIEGVMVQFGRLSDKKSHTKAQGENEMRESESIANARIRPEQMINWLQGTQGVQTLYLEQWLTDLIRRDRWEKAFC